MIKVPGAALSTESTQGVKVEATAESEKKIPPAEDGSEGNGIGGLAILGTGRISHNGCRKRRS